MQLQEKDILQDLLVLDKDIMKAYADYLIESTCPKERTLLEKNFKTTAQEQYKLFDTMNEKGYYPVKNAAPEDVKTAKQQMTQVKDQLS